MAPVGKSNHVLEVKDQLGKPASLDRRAIIAVSARQIPAEKAGEPPVEGTTFHLANGSNFHSLEDPKSMRDAFASYVQESAEA